MAAVTAALALTPCLGLAAEPSSAQQQAAERAFAEGNELFDAGEYSAAADKFRESYAALESPNSRIMLAQALMKAGKHVEAYREFSGTIADIEERADPRYDETEKAARAGRDAVRSEVGLLEIRLKGAGERAHVQVGSDLYDADDLGEAVAVAPGPVTISASAPDGGQASRDVNVDAGQSKSVELDLRATEESPAPSPGAGAPPTPSASPSQDSAPPAATPAEEPAMTSTPPEEPAMTSAPPETGADEQREDAGGLPLRAMAYASGALAVGGFVTFAVAGSMSDSQFEELEAACGNSPCPERQDDIDRGKLQQTVANVGFGVGLVGLAAGTSFFVLSLDQDEGESAGTSTRVMAGPGSVTVRGTF